MDSFSWCSNLWEVILIFLDAEILAWNRKYFGVRYVVEIWYWPNFIDVASFLVRKQGTGRYKTSHFFVLCLVDQECFETSRCAMLLNFWSWLLILLCTFGCVSIIIPFDFFMNFWLWILFWPASELWIFNLCIYWLLIMIYLICSLMYNWSPF